MLSLALAFGLVAPARSVASTLQSRGVEPPDPLSARVDRRKERREQGRKGVPTQLRSPNGRHLFESDGRVVRVDGREVFATSMGGTLLGEPVWRSDGAALAWLERRRGETRLVVVPEVAHPEEPIVWPLPSALSRDRPHWAGPTRVVVGPEPLQPRAVASWTDTVERR
jgi:hypothetical protein